MNAVVAVVIAVVALAMIGLLIVVIRSIGQSAERSAQDSAAAARSRHQGPEVASFHVRGETASVVFAVPLGDGEAGRHLSDLLAANAVEYVRARVHAGLPLEGVHRIEVSAMRGDTPEVVTTVDLPEVGELPDEAAILSRDPLHHDPIEALQAVASDHSVAAPSRDRDHLEPLADLVELSAPTEAHLRSLGVDTSSMSLRDLVVGLLTIGGYTVSPGSGVSMSSVASGDMYRVARPGETGIVVVVPYDGVSHPELDEKVLAEFAVAVGQANPTRAMLVTDKFGPYAMYEREKRDRRLVFVTRERLQAFVDSFGLQ